MRFSTFTFIVTITTLATASSSNLPVPSPIYPFPSCAFKCPKIFVEGNNSTYRSYGCTTWECMCSSGDFISEGFICITNACRPYPTDRQTALILWKAMCIPPGTSSTFTPSKFTTTLPDF